MDVNELHEKLTHHFSVCVATYSSTISEDLVFVALVQQYADSRDTRKDPTAAFTQIREDGLRCTSSWNSLSYVKDWPKSEKEVSPNNNWVRQQTTSREALVHPKRCAREIAAVGTSPFTTHGTYARAADAAVYTCAKLASHCCRRRRAGSLLVRAPSRAIRERILSRLVLRMYDDACM